MSARIVLHQWESSQFCNKVRKALAFKQLEFDIEEYAGLRSTRAPRLSEVGRLPVLDYGDVRVQDSTDILALLDARHPDPPLWPADPLARAHAELWEDWADESLGAFTSYYRWRDDPEVSRRAAELLCKGRPGYERALFRLIVPRRQRRRVARQLAELGRDRVDAQLEKHLDRIDAVLSQQPWLVGDAPSAADIAVAAQLDSLLQGTRVADHVTGRERIAEWLARCP